MKKPKKDTTNPKIVTDRRYVKPDDSEDQAGAYAPLKSADDSGESDDGVLAHAPHFREKKTEEEKKP